jgi:dienelactone hydrolase/CubicO group peptidase (beta-lactamase class C family)
MMTSAVLLLALAGSPAEIETRIERVVSGLLPATAVRNRWAAPARLPERMARFHTPGVSIAVVNEGRIEWARGFGVRAAGKRDPVTERTLFQAGSISKPVFALGVVRLAQEGKLDLDADVNTYLKTWKVPPNGQWQPRVTLRQILSHSAGLTVHGFPGYRTTEPLPTVVDVLEGRPPANTDPVRVNLVPGTQVRYAGGGTTVAQLAVTELLGKPFAQIMGETVLVPLGMADSTYEQPLPASRTSAAASAHPWKGDALPGRWHVYPEMAAAGLWTTAADLARVGIEMQKALRGESKLLAKERAAQMLSPTVQDDVGIGFFLEGKGEAQRFGHGGWDEGFVAKATFYKDRGQGAVVMINSNEGHELIDEVMRAVAKEYAWPGFFEEEKKAASVAPEVLDGYAGEYTAPLGFRATVTRREGGLLLTAGGQPALELTPESETGFFATASNTDVVFEKTGKTVKLTLKQGGPPTVAEKVARDAASEGLPPGESGAKAALDRSPRHGEWADVPGPGGQTLRSWVVYPERKDKAPVVIVIHEIYGLTDWIRAVADRLAADGFIAVAPDFISGKGPGGGGSDSVPSRDDVVKLIRALTPEEVDARLDAVREWAAKLPAASGKTSTLGFCWGGARSFAYATHYTGLGAAVVYYGSSPSDPAALVRIQAAVLGLYGGDDARVNATIAAAESELKRSGRTYEANVYEGAGHGFLRAQDDRDGANLRATQAAWPRTVAFLRKHLEGRE